MAGSSHAAARAFASTSRSVVAVVEDDPILRADFVSMLEDAGFSAQGYESAEALTATRWAEHTACLLLDAGLPGISGVELMNDLASKGIRVPVVMVSGEGDVGNAVRAMQVGACDFIEKPASAQETIAAIERAMSQNMAGAALQRLQHAAAQFTARLTPRQRDILPLILDGQPNKNIAIDLAISQRTVENHRAAIMEKAGAKSLPALARMMFAANLSPDSAMAGPVAAPGPARAESAPSLPARAGDIESERFERYFDQIPLAVAVASMAEPERVIYANPAFEALTGQARSALEGQPWSALRGDSTGGLPVISLGQAVLTGQDLVGTFRIKRQDGSTAMADVFSNVIIDDNDGPTFRLAALVDVGVRDNEKLQEFELMIRDRDTRLLEMQHRVKNNLQMITALIRIEARKAQGQVPNGPFDRLAGRINSIQLVYKLLSEGDQGDQIDLGVYLSEVASSIMHACAVEGIRLNLKVDSYLVAINVALPTGMVVNELLTNSLKHAFRGRDGGTITLESLADARGCRVVVADDGVGLPAEMEWPVPGKLGALIVHSLRQNAKADIDVKSQPGAGVRVTIDFSSQAAAGD